MTAARAEWPAGTRSAAGPFPAGPSGVGLLFDTTGRAVDGHRVCRQSILDAVCGLLDRAVSFALVDCFLWNDWEGPVPAAAGSPANRLVDALLALRQARPEAVILALTDPINRAYGRHPAAPLARLIAGGVPVVWTDLDRLPDANRIYSPTARQCARLLRRWHPARRFFDAPARHPFDPSGQPVRRADLLRLLHFKANHRKVVVTDARDGSLQALVASWNPHDGSAAHTNAALRFGGGAARAAASGELDCMAWSAARPGCVSGVSPAEAAHLIAQARAQLVALPNPAPVDPGAMAPRLTWLTEDAIRHALLGQLRAAGAGDTVRVALFYLSDRAIIEALAGAACRGADVRLILDPNRDAFGRTKHGIPNRGTAPELQRRMARRPGTGSLAIRWADTRGEQFHVKALSVARSAGGSLLLGSANWTRRNLAGFNMEADVLLEGDASTCRIFNAWFDARWNNTGGLACTLPFESFAERGPRLLFKTAIGRIQEAMGLGTF